MKLDTIPILSVYTTDRARQEFNKKEMDELRNSISEVGLITPIAVCYTEQEYKDKGVVQPYRLLAGERRLRVCTELQYKEIPVRIFDGDISRISAKSIEAAENFFRSDLTAEERVLLVKTIHEEQVLLHGPRISSHTKDGWSQKDTAALLGISTATVSLELQAAELIELHPELGLIEGLKKSDLIKAIKTMQQEDATAQLNAELEERAKNTRNEVTKTLSECLICASIIISENSYDIILADFRVGPPFTHEFMDVLYAALKSNSWLITMGIPQSPIAPSAPFYVRYCYDVKNKDPLIHELAIGVFHGYYYKKGNPQLHKPGTENLFGIHKHDELIGDNNLYYTLLNTFAYPGCKLLVPFVYNGEELIQAAKLGLIPLGYTQDITTRNIFLRKLSELEVLNVIEENISLDTEAEISRLS